MPGSRYEGWWVGGKQSGVGALSSLMLRSPVGLKAVGGEKEGVEVLVGGMLLCAREKLEFSSGVEALRLLAERQPESVTFGEPESGSHFRA